MSDKTTHDELQRQKADLEEFAAEAHELQDVLGTNGVDKLRAACGDAVAEVQTELENIRAEHERQAELQTPQDPLQWLLNDLPALVPRDGDLEFGVACRRAVAMASTYVSGLRADQVDLINVGTRLSGPETPRTAAIRAVLALILRTMEPQALDRRRVAPSAPDHLELKTLDVMLASLPGLSQSPQLLIILVASAVMGHNPDLVGDDLGVAVESLLRFHILLEDRRARQRPLELTEWEQLKGLLERALPQVITTFKDATGEAATEGASLHASFDNVIALVGAEIELRRRAAPVPA